MLTQLNIRNFGLIDEVSLEFNRGLNILTGETGAGKSIIIEALRIVLGDKISTSQIRATTAPCIIEAVFEINKDLRAIEAIKDTLEEENSLIINRTFSSDGKNKNKINGLNVTVAQLKQIGDYLIDFHGAHDHQLLFSSESHLAILDRMIDFKNLKRAYLETFAEYKTIEKKITDLQNLSATRDREIDFLSHQIKELEQVHLDEEVYKELKQRQDRLTNAERLQNLTSEIISLLEGETNGTAENVMNAFRPMKSLNQLDESTNGLSVILEDLQDKNNTLINELKAYADKLNFEPGEAEEVNKLCDCYDNIIRKYGPSLVKAKEFHKGIKEKYNLLVNIEENDSNLRENLKQKEKELSKIAESITKLRQKQSKELKETIEEELTQLGMPHVKFSVKIEADHFNSNGKDKVTFFISPNAGESLKPLSDIVSSGEAARVMLGLKKALIDVDPIPVLIFDEIDAQIGGRLGTITGKKLREISRIRQVILITHLPQIASFADCHYKVIKKVVSGKTFTKVELLNKETKVKELAQMMSGDKETEIAVKHASDMLSKAEK